MITLIFTVSLFLHINISDSVYVPCEYDHECGQGECWVGECYNGSCVAVGNCG